MSALLFDSWMGVARTIIIGVLAYVLLVVSLRISGKRTLAKLNAFDLVVTVALGSTLATALLTKDVAVVEGALGFALLIGMQFIVTWLSVRSGLVRRAVRDRPIALMMRGDVMRDAMRRARVTEGEVLAAVRGAGVSKLDDVEAVVLETDGSLSVVRRPPSGTADVLRDL